MPRPGCPCSEEGLKVVCGEEVGTSAGGLVCARGESTCNAGSWGSCAITGHVTLNPGFDAQTKGAPVGCSSPCDPYCSTFNDDPTGECDLPNGVCEDNGGVTLPGSNGGNPTPTCAGGQSGSCAHTICETGSQLAAGCDAAPTPPGAPSPVSETAYLQTFSSNDSWTFQGEWDRAAAQASSGQQYGHPDPSSDATPNNTDNRIAGVYIGGNASTSPHGYRYATSPVIDTNKYDLGLELRYSRWLNSDYDPRMTNVVEVYNGSSWVVVWQSGGSPGIIANAWTSVSHDVSAYANANFRVRFGFRVGSGAWEVSGWNLDDVEIIGTFAGGAPPPPTTGGSCVTQVCNADPSCCSGAWTQACVDKVLTVCGVQCTCTTTGAFVGCYHDAYDHDGDGYAGNDGDCYDCDPFINAGAYDFQNAIDDDCSGVVDDEPTDCDAALPMSTTDPLQHARAIDLCRSTTLTATGANKSWGVYGAQSHLAQANGASPPHNLSHGISSTFGSNNAPRKGSKMAVYSSGTARAPGDPGYVNPNGQVASFNQGTACAYPPGFPANASGCPTSGSTANDSAGLYLKMRAPTNANSFAYNFHFFSGEYPEWVCTPYNDHFVALLDSNQTTGNISFDTNDDPVSVNIAFFTIPGCETCTHAILDGTGFDGTCDGDICGGSTEWLFTSAPVTPGEELTIHFSTWDMGDHVWDSTVLIDNWTWSEEPAIVETGKANTPPPPQFTDGYFIRDYDATGVCPSGWRVVWDVWSWQADTPGDSYIDFTVATATSMAGLASANAYPIKFTNPPGPTQLAGTPAVAHAQPNDTQSGAAIVDKTLASAGAPRNQPYLRIVSHLAPSSDKSLAPSLLGWNLTIECEPTE
jgi:hypothetical protein